MFLNIKNNNKGLTMLEVTIAVSIIMIGILGVLIVSQGTLHDIYLASDKITAAYLAKEGMEIVRNLRDQNYVRIAKGVTGIGWNSGLNPGNYMADFDDYGLNPYTANTFLRINLNGFYHYDIRVPPLDPLTRFTRRIMISSVPEVPGGNAIRVNVRVNWGKHEFLVEEILYNWRH